MRCVETCLTRIVPLEMRGAFLWFILEWKFMKIDSSWYTRITNVPTRIAAGGIVVRWNEDELQVALTLERSQDPNGVEFEALELPKGKVEPGESLEDAAQREILEETGIHLLEPLYSGVYTTEERYGLYKGIWTEVSYFLYLTNQGDGEPSDPKHTLRWASLERMPDLFWPEQARILESKKDEIIRLAQTRTL